MHKVTTRRPPDGTVGHAASFRWRTSKARGKKKPMRKNVIVPKNSKLSLAKETLRRLGSDELRNVAGAGTHPHGLCDSVGGSDAKTVGELCIPI